MRIESIDPAVDADFRRWFTVYDACFSYDWPGEPGWQYAERRAKALDNGGAEDITDLVAVDDNNVVVATAELCLPRLDNLQRADVEIAVLPEHRRRGYGTALLDDCERLVRAARRSLVLGYYEFPYAKAGPPPGDGFCAARGYAVEQRELQRELRLPYDAARLEALEKACLPYAEGYRLVRWRDRCPEDLVEGRAELGRRMSTDAPRGGLDLEEEEWDVARVRANEKLIAEQDRTFLAVGAVHEASGDLVAFTEIGIPRGEPRKAYQWDTLVRADHRGHRLGTLIKIENLRALAAASPATTAVTTWNAVENAPMIAVNEALGCVVVGTVTVVQKHLS